MTPFQALFVPAALADAVAGRSWLAAMLDAEKALVKAGAATGLVPEPAAAAIADACSGDYDWDQLLEEGRSSGNPAEPLVRAIVARVGEDDARYVHLGATSQDVLDTAAMLVARRALGFVLGDLARVTSACARLAREHRDTPMAGRTLLQQAVPTTFGLKSAGWLVAVMDARARLVELRERGLAAQLGGAAGTLSALGDRGLELSALYARELGLAEPTLPWHANRVRIAELGAALEIAAGVLGKVGLDLELLAQTEVGEVREGGEGGGSSAMPHKRNPVGAMWARAGAALVRGHASVLTAALVAEHERAGGAWQAEWDALSGALATTGGAASALAGSLEGLEVDAARMRTNLELSGGAVLTERLAAILTDRLGRIAARSLVRDVSLRASDSGRPLSEELAERDTGLTADELGAALDPATYLGSAGALVDRALARYEAERTEEEREG
ncbi:MAG TPA: 3-carboxy-cis,cis-muconate cycloisomerase [Gaiella sp.]|uniref:3-carboxy-cis,cis-muconate cycloisomerase n=1 Tax=Gaiella sp. TaxID=2663207 RepID=UPI002D7E71B2|nr:3-carboxy-cis,cis-muconate cycloisomerase [Gaiella sp.]HET9288727.1 3-carboxy-cis,cis-muconate cycloisomerase [Gaiella sp.]